eukprot:SAG11_NODE_2946_length_2820_cov_2.023153_3_plen_164_part_00
MAHMETPIQHAEDWEMIQECMQWLTSHDPSNTADNWFLYCSINIPHPGAFMGDELSFSHMQTSHRFVFCSVNIPRPGYQSNSTWLPLVNRSLIPLPTWIPKAVRGCLSSSFSAFPCGPTALTEEHFLHSGDAPGGLLHELLQGLVSLCNCSPRTLLLADRASS